MQTPHKQGTFCTLPTMSSHLHSVSISFGSILFSSKLVINTAGRTCLSPAEQISGAGVCAAASAEHPLLVQLLALPRMLRGCSTTLFHLHWSYWHRSRFTPWHFLFSLPLSEKSRLRYHICQEIGRKAANFRLFPIFCSLVLVSFEGLGFFKATRRGEIKGRE